MLEGKFGKRSDAARECNVDLAVLRKIGHLSSNKGGSQARKAKGTDTELGAQEASFLEQAIARLIMRLAQVSADTNTGLPQINLSDFHHSDD